MASANLSLPSTNGSSAVAISYEKRGGTETNIQYVGNNASDSLAAPRLIDVKLDIKNPGVIGNDRVYVSAKQVVLDSDNLPHTGSVSVTVSIPRVAQWAASNTIALLTQVASYIGGFANASVSGATDTSAFPAAIAKGIVP